MPTLPTPVQEKVMTAYDRFVAEGEIKGIIKARLEFFINLLINLPNASDDLLVTITKFPKAVVVDLKKAIKGRTKQPVLKAGRQFFESLPDIQERQWKEIDMYLLTLWKEYKKEILKRKDKK